MSSLLPILSEGYCCEWKFVALKVMRGRRSLVAYRLGISEHTVANYRRRWRDFNMAMCQACKVAAGLEEGTAPSASDRDPPPS